MTESRLYMEDADKEIVRPRPKPWGLAPVAVNAAGSTFHFLCVCGREVETNVREGFCRCGRGYDLTYWGKG